MSVTTHSARSQDFDCGFSDMAESAADGDNVSNDTDPTKGLIVNAMARQSTNPSLVDSTADEGAAGHITPEHNVDPFGFDGRTVVSSYVPLICVMLMLPGVARL